MWWCGSVCCAVVVAVKWLRIFEKLLNIRMELQLKKSSTVMHGNVYVLCMERASSVFASVCMC